MHAYHVILVGLVQPVYCFELSKPVSINIFSGVLFTVIAKCFKRAQEGFGVLWRITAGEQAENAAWDR